MDSELANASGAAEDDNPLVKFWILSFLWETHARTSNQTQARCLFVVNDYIVTFMSMAYQDPDANGGSFFQGNIIWLEESQVLIHQELTGNISKSVTQNGGMNLRIPGKYSTQEFPTSYWRHHH